jgi:hypothetical protein
MTYVIHTSSDGSHTRCRTRLLSCFIGPSKQGKMPDYDTTRNLTLQFVIHFAGLVKTLTGEDNGVNSGQLVSV